MTVVTAVVVSVWLFAGCSLTTVHGPVDLTARVEAFIIGVVIAAWFGGPALAGGLMIYEVSVTGSSSVPGSVGLWIVRSVLATAVWFSLVLAAASVFEKANALIVVASLLLSVAAAWGVLFLLTLGS